MGVGGRVNHTTENVKQLLWYFLYFSLFAIHTAANIILEYAPKIYLNRSIEVNYNPNIITKIVEKRQDD